MKFLIVFAVVISVAAAAEIFRGTPHLDNHWKSYKEKHGKTYNNTVHEGRRRQNWEKTHARIVQHNAEALNGKHSYTMEENHLSDLHDHELSTLNGAKAPKHHLRSTDVALPATNRNVPTSIDFRTSPCMTPIEDQGQCQSCWAFAASTPLSFALCNKTGTPVWLSEQQLVDCSSSYGCSRGGWYTSAWEYVKNAPGQATLSTYPYTAEDGDCSYEPSTSAGTVTGFVSYLRTEDSIMSAVALHGAVAASLQVLSSFHSYSSGVYADASCPSDVKTVNHGVVIVGYGTQNDVKYWIIRNSWATRWGMKGYAFIKRGVNMCNIESWVAYPLV